MADLDRSRKSILYDDSDIPQDFKAIYHNGTICLMSGYLKDILGSDMRMIRREWKKKKYTFSRDTKDDTDVVRTGRLTNRAVKINPMVLSELGYDFSDRNAEPQGNVMKFPFKNNLK